MASFNRLFLASGEDGVKKERKPGTPKISSLHYEKLSKSPHQYREFARGDVEQLADMIAADGGILQPLLVRRSDADQYEILAGHKRREAARILAEERGLGKYAFLPCIVTNVDDIHARFSVVSTNARPQQSPYETLHEIEEMRMLLTEYPEAFPDLKGGRMVERLAGQLHMSRSTVSEYRSIANNLGEKGMEAFKAGAIGKSAAVSLASLPQEEQDVLLGEGKLTDTEIKEYKKGKTAQADAAQETGRREAETGMAAGNAAGQGTASMEKSVEKPGREVLDSPALQEEPQTAGRTCPEHASRHGLAARAASPAEGTEMPEGTPRFCAADIQACLRKKEEELEMYEKCEETEGEFPVQVMKEKRMVIAGLRLLLASEKGRE